MLQLVYMKLNIIHLNIERDKHLDSVLQLVKNKNPDIVCFEEALLEDIKKISLELKYEYAFAPPLL
ncbi:MAG TPA: endonuclease/exonuclease/phosphatase family protein [Candidatus Paceibacterota bacterium]